MKWGSGGRVRALATWGRLEVRESWVGLPVVCTLERRFPSADQPEDPQSNPCLPGPVSSRHWCPLNAVPVVSPHSIKDCWYLMQRSCQNRHTAPQLAGTLSGLQSLEKGKLLQKREKQLAKLGVRKGTHIYSASSEPGTVRRFTGIVLFHPHNKPELELCLL